MSWSRKRDRSQEIRLKASLAEWIAEGGSARAWATEAGLSQAYASKLWRSIVRGLGWQAQ
jgi:hypothetical protein